MLVFALNLHCHDIVHEEYFRRFTERVEMDESIAAAVGVVAVIVVAAVGAVVVVPLATKRTA